MDQIYVRNWPHTRFSAHSQYFVHILITYSAPKLISHLPTFIEPTTSQLPIHNTLTITPSLIFLHLAQHSWQAGMVEKGGISSRGLATNWGTIERQAWLIFSVLVSMLDEGSNKIRSNNKTALILWGHPCLPISILCAGLKNDVLHVVCK